MSSDWNEINNLDLEKALDELTQRCKGSVTIEFNEHRSCYQTVEMYMEEEMCGEKNSDSISELNCQEILQEMIKRDTVVKLQFYPSTPIGFYRITHYSLKEALKEALFIIQTQEKSS